MPGSAFPSTQCHLADANVHTCLPAVQRSAPHAIVPRVEPGGSGTFSGSAASGVVSRLGSGDAGALVLGGSSTSPGARELDRDVAAAGSVIRVSRPEQSTLPAAARIDVTKMRAYPRTQRMLATLAR
jgi:hypothetical protein